MSPGNEEVLARNIYGICYAEASEISISAKITNLELWKNIPEIRHICEVKLGENCWIVTARGGNSIVKLLEGKDFVLSVKAAMTIIAGHGAIQQVIAG